MVRSMTSCLVWFSATLISSRRMIGIKYSPGCYSGYCNGRVSSAISSSSRINVLLSWNCESTPLDSSYCWSDIKLDGSLSSAIDFIANVALLSFCFASEKKGFLFSRLVDYFFWEMVVAAPLRLYILLGSFAMFFNADLLLTNLVLFAKTFGLPLELFKDDLKPEGVIAFLRIVAIVLFGTKVYSI